MSALALAGLLFVPALVSAQPNIEPLTIEVESSTVMQGENLRWRIRAGRPPFAPIIIKVRIRASRDGVIASSSREVEAAVGMGPNFNSVQDSSVSEWQELPTLGNPLPEPDSRVTFSFRSIFGTDTRFRFGSSVTVTVRDDDEPFDARIRALAPEVLEGGDARFEVRVSEIAPVPLTVNVALSGGGDFGVLERTRQVLIAMSSSRVILDEMIVPDDLTEPDGVLRAEIVAGAGYVSEAPFSAATIILRDDDLPPGATRPRMTIRALAREVLEGGDARFRVEADRELSSPLEVNVALSGGGDFGVLARTRKVLIAMSSSEMLLPVPTMPDDEDEPNDTLVATIEPGAGYTGDGSTARMLIRDDDATPGVYEASVRALAPQVTEGEQARFEVHLSEPSPTPFIVQVALESRARGIDQAGPVVFAMGATTTPLVVPTIDTLVYERGTLAARIASGAGYVSGYPDSAEVEIVDARGTGIPTVWISAESPEVIEDNPARFRIDARSIVPASFAVNVALSASGDFGVLERVRTVLIAMSSTHEILDVPTMGDEEDELDGMLVATIVPDAGYIVGDATAQVTLLDDDDPPLPRVSIRALTRQVTEGDDARFQVYVNADLSAPLSVKVGFSGGEDFGIAATTTQLMFGPATTSVVLTVSTKDDKQDEPDGPLVATIGPGAGYVVDGAPARATLLDNDSPPPRASIRALTRAVTEGGDASFQVYVNGTVSAPFSVGVSLLGGEEFGIAATTTQLMFGPATTSVILTVPTKDDGHDELNGALVATIEPGAGYVVSGASVRVTLQDNDAPLPRVSIRALAPEVLEGGDARFEVRTNNIQSSPLSVDVALSGGADFGVLERVRQVVIAISSTRELLDVPTMDSEQDGVLRAEVVAGERYVPGTSPVATVTLLNVEPLTADEPEAVPGGESATFAVSAETAVRVRNGTGEGVSISRDVASSSPVVLEVAADDGGGGASGGAFAGARIHLPASLLGDEEDASDEGVGFEVTLNASTTAIAAAEASPDVPAGFAAPEEGVKAFDITVTRRDGGALAEDQRVDICLPFDAMEDGAPAVFRFAGSAWQPLDNSSATGEGLVCGATRQFSAFAVFYLSAVPDANDDGMVDANDALIFYYAYSLQSVLGAGR